MLDEFYQNLIVGSIRVYPPKRYVLICGGEVGSIVDLFPRSLRDAFLRGDGFNAIKNSEILQIEEIRDFFDKESPYLDLVKFETDIAQISELVMLFSESPGSFAELGCFSMTEEIHEKILVILQSHHLSKSTFITKGPVANFRRQFPRSVFAIVDASIGVVDTSVENVDCKKLVDIISKPLSERLKETEGRTTLDVSKFNHLSKIYVGLLREFYCLKDDEILLLLWEIGFSLDLEILNRVAFCCAALKWSKTTSVGFDRVHYAVRGNNEAAKFEFAPPLSDKIRRRAEFRKYWEDIDPDRVSAVDKELS